jgi:hypothetical protein
MALHASHNKDDRIRDIVEGLQEAHGRPVTYEEIRTTWRTAVHADDNLRDKANAVARLDKSLRVLEATRELSLRWIDGVPHWGRGQRISRDDRLRRLVTGNRNTKRKLERWHS